MVNNKKKRREKKPKAEPVYRTKEERQSDVKPIIAKLTELRLTTDYDEVRELFQLCQKYIADGIRTEISIPFPAIGRTIVGVLATNKREQTWVKMEKSK